MFNRKENHSDITTLANHMANERTFLAWIRTSIGIMVFGFVIEKFSFFLKEVTSGFVSQKIQIYTPFLQGYSQFFGIALVVLGAILSLFAFLKYKHIERQINNNTYCPNILLDIMLTIAVILAAVVLVMALVT